MISASRQYIMRIGISIRVTRCAYTRCTCLYSIVSTVYLLASPAFAQQWEVSLKSGPTFTTFSGEFVPDMTFEWDHRFGFAAGGSVGFKFSNGVIPTVELAYWDMGAQWSTTFTYPNDYDNGTTKVPFTAHYKLGYLITTLLVQYQFGTNWYVEPRISAGPSLAKNVRDVLVSESELTSEEGALYVRSFDFGYTFAGDFDVNVGTVALFIEARYSIGLRNILDDVGGLLERSGTIKNTGVAVMGGIRF